MDWSMSTISKGTRISLNKKHENKLCTCPHLNLFSGDAVPLKALQHALQQRLGDQVIKARHYHPETQAPSDQASNVRCHGAAHRRAPPLSPQPHRSAPACPAYTALQSFAQAAPPGMVANCCSIAERAQRCSPGAGILLQGARAALPGLQGRELHLEPPAWSPLNKDAGRCCGLLGDTHRAYCGRPCRQNSQFLTPPVATQHGKACGLRKEGEEEASPGHGLDHTVDRSS